MSAFTAQMGHRDYLPAEVEDNAVAILRFAGGALGVIDSKWGQIGPPPVRTSFHGVRGTITSGPGGTELYSTAQPAVPEGWEPIEPLPSVGMFAAPAELRGWRAPSLPSSSAGRGGREQRYFVDCLLQRRPSPYVLPSRRGGGPDTHRLRRDRTGGAQAPADRPGLHRLGGVVSLARRPFRRRQRSDQRGRRGGRQGSRIGRPGSWKPWWPTAFWPAMQ